MDGYTTLPDIWIVRMRADSSTTTHHEYFMTHDDAQTKVEELLEAWDEAWHEQLIPR